MSGFAVARGRDHPQLIRRVSDWERYVTCAIVGAFAAAWLRFGDHVTGTYVALSLALPVFWVGALWRARFTVRKRLAPPDEAAKYADHVRRRLLAKSGLTGLWQASGQSVPFWGKPVRLDRRYVENCSFALRPAPRLRDLLSTGSQVGRVLADLRR
jgi:hypothetical protein